MRILAIDYGKKRCGLAVTDPLRLTAQPLKTVATEKLISAFFEFQSGHEEKIEKIVLGYPIQMNGHPGVAAKQMEGVKDRLEKRLGLPVEFMDERLTTVLAQRLLTETAGVASKNQKGIRDMLAAVTLLQEYLKKEHR